MREPTIAPPSRTAARPLSGDASPPTLAVLALIAALAVIVPAWIVRTAPPVKARPPIYLAPKPVVPKAVMPPVDPVTFRDLPPEDARSFNATIPFSTDPNPPARPFRLAESDIDVGRATDCLAAAVLYEAGDDAVGEKAVAQVVLNRVRHPAFPKTVCGVVFDGAERRTGCQFTFSCDGALLRHNWSEAAWTRARAIATAALNGAVYRPVGQSTHYHTDWVVPYWSSSLDKVSAVGSHLFFRWTGWWGTPAAFNRQVQPGEPLIAMLARLSPFHRDATLDPGAVAEGTVDTKAAQALAKGIQPLKGDPNSFLVTFDRKTPPDSFAAIANSACADRAYCKFIAWVGPGHATGALPSDADQVASMAFSYLRDRSRNYEKALWNCETFQRTNPLQCMKAQVLLTTITKLPSQSDMPRPALLAPKPVLLLGKPELRRPEPSTVEPSGTAARAVDNPGAPSLASGTRTRPPAPTGTAPKPAPADTATKPAPDGR